MKRGGCAKSTRFLQIIIEFVLLAKCFAQDDIEGKLGLDGQLHLQEYQQLCINLCRPRTASQKV